MSTTHTEGAAPVPTSSDLTGQVCLVTGGARGIGYGIAQELISQGAQVAVVDIGGADDVAARLGDNAAAWTADVRDRAQVTRCVAGVVERFGRLDVLVNNAGTAARIDLEAMDDDTWDRDIATNLKGTYLFTQAAIYPHMRNQGYGRIINISSISGIMGGPYSSGEGGGRSGPAYAASKGGIIAFTKWLAKDVGALGITANSVAPGPVATPLTSDVDYPLDNQAIKRMGDPEDIAGAVAYLASPRTGFVTGETLKVCGGSAIG
ncbi:SDR family NAD(P)-dependent oxidoreductase [Nesterenkonia muleiensis]|uniref:SDR family NAD(P)-dependent oxidoreductase n=1 Tax=Nesterenkonia muleiensis TaxID=2282648 RepID=UPI000E75758E|nr:SDR family oxidoreductase [Nesterenkonia muleiensis]